MNKTIAIVFTIIGICLIIGMYYFLFFYDNTNTSDLVVFDNQGEVYSDNNFLDFKLNNNCGSKNKDLVIDVNIDNKPTKIICTNIFTYNYTWQDYNVYIKYTDINNNAIDNNGKLKNLKNKLDYNVFDGKECNEIDFGLTKKDANGNSFRCIENLTSNLGYVWVAVNNSIVPGTINPNEETAIFVGQSCTGQEEFNTKENIDGNTFICLKNELEQGYSWKIKEDPVLEEDEIVINYEGQACDLLFEFQATIDINNGNMIRCMFVDGNYFWVKE